MRPLLWIGSSLKDLKVMPEEVKKEFGHALREIQKGRDPGNTKPLKHLGKSGVLEIIVNEKAGAFRTVYTIQFKDIVAVLYPERFKNWNLTKLAPWIWIRHLAGVEAAPVDTQGRCRRIQSQGCQQSQNQFLKHDGYTCFSKKEHVWHCNTKERT